MKAGLKNEGSSTHAVQTELGSLQMTAFAEQIRRIIIEQSKRAKVGHIGSALSIADIIATLYSRTLKISTEKTNSQDRFILSKGHAALALYAGLYLRGFISELTLNTFCGDNSALGVHPEHAVPGIDYSTGSLGQGLSVASGMALAARMKGEGHRVFALLSDAECNEGSVWESIMFAAHHEFANLVVIVDLNGQQAFGHTKEVLDLSPMSARWSAFGWDVHEVDGHDTEALYKTLSTLNTTVGRPHVLIAKTTFGKGVSYMENQIKWHYSPMSDADFETAMKELGGSK